MKSKKTQLILVKSKLLREGKISRNWCLRHYISRLSAFIYALRNEGLKIEGGFFKTKTGTDYIYTLTK